VATITQVRAALTDVGSVLDQADAMLAMGNVDDDVRDALDELLDELARVGPTAGGQTENIAPLVMKTDRVRDLLDQVKPRPRLAGATARPGATRQPQHLWVTRDHMGDLVCVLRSDVSPRPDRRGALRAVCHGLWTGRARFL
jgi:hypothetical protein